MTFRHRLALSLLLCLVLPACERLNEITNQAKLNGRAIGAACRHSGRALEDCFQRNPRVPKADIYAGWREMNEYMTSKKLDVVPPPPDQPRKGSVEPTVQIGGETEGGAPPGGTPTGGAAPAGTPPATTTPRQPS
ncbi:hypothetical protein [Chitinimonas lacunae]|uniref:Uncharacterized protein n=1 Tax=Chitinimonas lacunae TaxID=1963018 RepID=A0ABV8MPS4_9NEIS